MTILETLQTDRDMGLPENPNAGMEHAQAAWKISPWEVRESDNLPYFGPESAPGPIAGVVGDGVAAATAAKTLAKEGYRVIVFGADPGGQAFSKIDEIEHHNTRAGGVRIAAKGLTEAGIRFVPQRIELTRLSELADALSLSGIVVAVGGAENLNKNVDYRIPGVMGMWDFIDRYHNHMNAGLPVSALDLGLPIGHTAYPEMSFLVQGAGRGVEDIGRKLRYLQAVVAAERMGNPFEDAKRNALFAGPRETPGHKRMLENFAALGVPVDRFGRGMVMHRGEAGDFKWNDPKDRDMTQAILTVQQDAGLRSALRRLFDASPSASPDKIVELFIRKHNPAFRAAIASEVEEWLDGYRLELLGKSEILATEKTANGAIKVTAKGPTGEFTFETNILITSLGSKGITLPIEETRAPDGTFISAQVRRSDGQVVPVALAGMSFDGRGAVGPSVKQSEKTSKDLAARIVKLGGNTAPDAEVYQRVLDAVSLAQQSIGFSGDVMELLLHPSRKGAFPEFFNR